MPDQVLIKAWGVDMPKHRVNLDALIQREDLEMLPGDQKAKAGGNVPAINLVDLVEDRPMFEVLRKPDFQRETSEWTPEQVLELVKNILDDELVPAVIVWKAANRSVFVIDGAHRLSALIAWVNDDYGDESISQKFYGGADKITKAQAEAATATRNLINSQIGSYQSLSRFRKDESGGTPDQIRRARNIATAYVFVQSITRDDAAQAEASFYRINQGGAIIDDYETEIILSRNRPEALAARALLRAGTGYDYWWRFGQAVQLEIKELSHEIYELLYEPELQDTYRTLDLPMAGGGYSHNALAVLYEFIFITNDLPHGHRVKTAKAFTPLPKEDEKRDVDGSQTIQYLKAVRNVAEIIASAKAKSLGLHPAVYSYTATGKFQPAAFFAQVKFVKKLEAQDAFIEFLQHRERFEDFLVNHKLFLNQLVGGHGSMTRSMDRIAEFNEKVFAYVKAGKTDDEIRESLISDPNFSSHLRIPSPDSSKREGGKFSRETKAAIRLKAALDAAQRCPICKARVHINSTSIDHKVRLEDGGGSGHSDLGQVTHPRCNTGYKEWMVIEQRRKASHP